MDPRVEPEGDDWWRMWIRDFHTHNVIPVKTGIQCTASAVQKAIHAGRTARCWIPACAGMTTELVRELCHVFGHPPGTYLILSLSKDGRHARCPKPRPSTGSG